MKNLLLTMLVFISISASAQNGKFSISIGPSISSPLDRAKEDYFKTGFGGSLKTYYSISKHGAIMAHVNYMNFGSNAKPAIPSFSLSSIKLGYRNFIGNTTLFVQGDAGLVVASSNGYTRNVLGASAGFGYSLPVGKMGHIDIAPGFNYLKTQFVRNNYADLNLSYRFRLGKK